jgi:predicted transcriptional regulator
VSNEEWEELVEEYKESKLSKYEFCKQKNIPRSTFYKWSKIFAENDKNAVKSKFIPVKVEDWEEARVEEIKSELIIESKSGLRIEFRNGWKIEE